MLCILAQLSPSATLQIEINVTMKIEIKIRMEIKIELISTAGKRPKVAENEEQGDKTKG